MQRLETVMLGPHEAYRLIIADIFQTGHGSVYFSPEDTFSLKGNLGNWKLNYIKSFAKRNKSFSISLKSVRMKGVEKKPTKETTKTTQVWAQTL